ncbi:Hsp20 family protein [Dyadobacter subterraneus]|uniref:Hsp20 family protein n=1 Tax=Dyadobacter subterraneus TaxID=2773304 RepID=A0ABR9WEE1_9BACT|nr:Hsp20 family protein [Dyadobacter subterraneus]
MCGDQDGISASYDNGLLHICIPRKEEARGCPRLIEVV